MRLVMLQQALGIEKVRYQRDFVYVQDIKIRPTIAQIQGASPQKLPTECCWCPKLRVAENKLCQNPDQALKEFSKVKPRKPCFFISLLRLSSRSLNSIKVKTVKIGNFVQILILDWLPLKNLLHPPFYQGYSFGVSLRVGCVPRNPFEEEKGFTLHCIKMKSGFEQQVG